LSWAADEGFREMLEHHLDEKPDYQTAHDYRNRYLIELIKRRNDGA
jgi:hypothetical protein